MTNGDKSRTERHIRLSIDSVDEAFPKHSPSKHVKDKRKLKYYVADQFHRVQIEVMGEISRMEN